MQICRASLYPPANFYCFLLRQPYHRPSIPSIRFKPWLFHTLPIAFKGHSFLPSNFGFKVHDLIFFLDSAFILCWIGEIFGSALSWFKLNVDLNSYWNWLFNVKWFWVLFFFFFSVPEFPFMYLKIETLKCHCNGKWEMIKCWELVWFKDVMDER